MDLSPMDLDRLRIPRQNGETLVEPPSGRVAEQLAKNRRMAAMRNYDLQGCSLASVSRLARAELLAAARRWTATYRNVPTAQSDPQGPIFLAGHQPTLFHPGVWFKNFVLGRLARAHGATAVNVLVDADVLTEAFISVPGGSLARPTLEPVAFDRPEPQIPFEARRIEDREVFGSFGQRAAERIAPLVADPLVARYWPLVVARANETDNLGACLAQARHRLEAEFSFSETLEVPQSRLSSGEAFGRFVAHLLARLPQFHAAYNATIREYRATHGVRSRRHPAPELDAEGAWLEAPLWVSTADDPRRRRLFAQAVGREIELSDRGAWRARLPLGSEGDAAKAVERLAELADQGVRVRSRALVTTLWARLALGDLFVHGIGGAKYDRATDRLIERFFGFPAPAVVVASATLHLPVARTKATTDERRAIDAQLRDMVYHPERHFDRDLPVDAAAWVAAKRRWIAAEATPKNARRRCHAIREANAALQPWLQERRRRLLDQREEVEQRKKAEKILASREYAFCLFPERALQGLFATDW